MHCKILILDFGAQYTQLIARRVRELNTYCEIHPHDVPPSFIAGFAPNGIILSGGPESVTAGDTPRAPAPVWTAGVPVLGICYGMQTMAAQLGGAVEDGLTREFGYAEVRARGHGRLLDGIQDRSGTDGQGLLDVWMSHGDKVTSLPPGFALMASNEATPIAAMMDESRRFYGVQFHPEVTHTRQGKAILQRFVRDICGCPGDWTMPAYVDEAIAKIRSQVGDDEVILGLSGGVDSSVAAALIHRAIGQQLTCIFVDTGLLREGEAAQVMATFAEHLGVRVDMVDASEAFLRELAGVADPEQKRKIIGREFVHVFPGGSRQATDWRNCGQVAGAGHHLSGCDRIRRCEDRQGAYDQIASQRRRPARNAASEAARASARAVQGRSARAWPGPRPAAGMVFRHPFPGPGLGVRILGEVKREYADLLRRADAIFIDELREAGWYDRVAQAFAVFLPVRSVGVMGDGRTYEHVVALRAVADDRLHDRPLGAAAARAAGARVEPDHQRSSRHQPRRLRHLRQTAGDDRMGVEATR